MLVSTVEWAVNHETSFIEVMRDDKLIVMIQFMMATKPTSSAIYKTFANIFGLLNSSGDIACFL